MITRSITGQLFKFQSVPVEGLSVDSEFLQKFDVPKDRNVGFKKIRFPSELLDHGPKSNFSKRVYEYDVYVNGEILCGNL